MLEEIWRHILVGYLDIPISGYMRWIFWWDGYRMVCLYAGVDTLSQLKTRLLLSLNATLHTSMQNCDTAVKREHYITRNTFGVVFLLRGAFIKKLFLGYHPKFSFHILKVF